MPGNDLDPAQFWMVEEVFLDEAHDCLKRLRDYQRAPLFSESESIQKLQEDLFRKAETHQQKRQSFFRLGKPNPLFPEDRRRIRNKLEAVSTALRQQFWFY